MITMLAQSTDLPAVPSETLKWVLIILVVILFVGLAVYAAINTAREKRLTINDDPAPQFERAPKRYNHEAVDQRFGRVESRLRDHDLKFEKLAEERHEDEKAQQKQNVRVMFALGKIAERLNVDIEPTE
jgi:flagellar basal body-associated protein FliL